MYKRITNREKCRTRLKSSTYRLFKNHIRYKNRIVSLLRRIRLTDSHPSFTIAQPSLNQSRNKICELTRLFYRIVK
jgi:hypothetical protein